MPFTRKIDEFNLDAGGTLVLLILLGLYIMMGEMLQHHVSCSRQGISFIFYYYFMSAVKIPSI